MKILVTGGAGFIGSAVIRHLISKTNATVLNVDSLTYAGNLESLSDVANNHRYSFSKTDICDAAGLRSVMFEFKPTHIMHLAAESHVDRSIDGPRAFIETNIMGTYNLLEVARDYWNSLETSRKADFRFLHVSTDEVFGSLGSSGLFSETSPYRPNSPYSASKASADHLVRAWHKTFGLPIVVTNCSNNYGPYQFPEKLIPLMVLNCIGGKPLPVYGKGDNIRDWLYVEDHADALVTVVQRGLVGETYNIGGKTEKTNLEVVHLLCGFADEFLPTSKFSPHKKLITFVQDRPGHDKRYAIDSSKIERELEWRPRESFESGLKKTFQWYLENTIWWKRIHDGSYRGERLGL